MWIHFSMFWISHDLDTFSGKYSPIQSRHMVSLNLTFLYILCSNLLSTLLGPFYLSSFGIGGGIYTYLWKKISLDHSCFCSFLRALFLVGDRPSFLENWLDFYSIGKYSSLMWLCCLLLRMPFMTTFLIHQILVFYSSRFLSEHNHTCTTGFVITSNIDFFLLPILTLMLYPYLLCLLEILVVLNFSYYHSTFLGNIEYWSKGPLNLDTLLLFHPVGYYCCWNLKYLSFLLLFV